MNLALKDKKKKMGISRFFDSFKYSFYGLWYAFKNEQSFMVMNICFVLAVIFGFILKISIVEWIYVIFAIGMVLGSELLNTAVEAIVDLVSPGYNEFAKIAKDTASAAAFIFSLMSLVIACIVYIPNFMEMMGWC